MPPTSNNSFIPKQGPAKRVRQTASRQIHIFTIITYVLFVATLLAAVSVFFYNQHIEKQLAAAVEALDNEIKSFSEADMERVREFDVRLKQAESRLDASVSVNAIFEALEEAALRTVTLSELELKREADAHYRLAAKIETDNFDSSLFQRGIFERNQVLDSVVLEELALNESSEEEGAPVISGVSFVAKIGVPIDAIPYSPSNPVAPVITEPTPPAPAATATTPSVNADPN